MRDSKSLEGKDVKREVRRPVKAFRAKKDYQETPELI